MQNPILPSNARAWNRPVTPDMIRWSVSMLNDPFAYPMFAESRRRFGGSTVLARIERRCDAYRNGVKTPGPYRGVGLYEIVATQSGIVEGCEVSHIQWLVDWERVAAADKAFVYVKLSEGSSLLDCAFERNWAGAGAAGILRGALHFFRPKEDPLLQAKFFLSRLPGRGELPVAVDVETGNGLASREVALRVATFVDHVATNYGRPAIFVSPGFWATLPKLGIEERSDLWVSDWDVDLPGDVSGWPGWSFWQYASADRVSGIAGAVDLSRFNGTLDDLHVYLTRRSENREPTPASFDVSALLGVQRALNSLGNSPPLIADGALDERTRDAIEAFQRAVGLAVCGVPTEETQVALRKALQLQGLVP